MAIELLKDNFMAKLEIKDPETVETLLAFGFNEEGQFETNPVAEDELNLGHTSYEGSLGDELPESVLFNLEEQKITVIYADNTKMTVGSIQPSDLPRLTHLEKELREGAIPFKPVFGLYPVNGNNEAQPGAIVDVVFQSNHLKL